VPALLFTVSAGCLDGVGDRLGEHAPWIDTEPTDVVVPEGDPATFSVEANGSGTLSYQWQRNGVDVPGATADTLTIPTTVLADSGSEYACVVTNHIGAARSGAATLTVVPDAGGGLIITDGARQLAPGVLALGGEVLEVRIENDVAYFLRPWCVDVYDVSGDTPTLLGWFPTDGIASYMTVQDGYVYLGSWDHYDLVVYDATDLTSVAEVGRLTTTDNVSNGVIVGTYGYFENRYGGLLIVDLSDKTNPTNAGSVASGTYVGSVDYLNGLLWVTMTTNGVYVYSIADPTNPTDVGHVASTWSSQNVDLNGDLLAVADGIGAAQVVDVTDPALPVQLGTTGVDDYGLDVAWYGDHVYLADAAGGVHVIDASVPTALSRVGTLQDGGYSRSVLVNGTKLYVTDLVAGLLIYDLADPASPTLVRQVEPGTGVEGLDVTGDIAYVTNRHALVTHSLTNERVLGSASVLDYSEAIEVYNGIAYCEGNDFVSDWLDILDVTEATAPAKIDRFVFPGPRVFAHRMVGRDSVLYVSRSTCGLETYDVTTPTTPILLDAYATGGSALGLVLDGNTAYVGDTTNGLVILDVTDPDAIAFVSQLPQANTGWVAKTGNVVYTTDATPECIRVIDVSVPASPSEVTSVTTSSGSSRDLCIAGGYLWHANGAGGLDVFDISNPLAPSLETTLFPGEDIWACQPWGNKVVVGDRYAGLYIIDPAEALAP
jgi:hypothetical protein